jgi:glutaredoxin
MTDRNVLPDSQRSEAVRAQLVSFHPEVVERVRAAVASHAVVVVGMAQNPFVKKARRALDDANVSYEYVEYGSYVSMWKERLAIKLWSGYPTYPQVFVNQILVGGYRELKGMLDAGKLR